MKYPSKSLIKSFLVTALLGMYTLLSRNLRSAILISIHNNLPSVSLFTEMTLKETCLLSKMATPQLLVVPKDQKDFPSHNFENFAASPIQWTCVSCRNTMSKPKLFNLVKTIICLNPCLNPFILILHNFSTIFMLYEWPPPPLKSPTIEHWPLSHWPRLGVNDWLLQRSFLALIHWSLLHLVLLRPPITPRHLCESPPSCILNRMLLWGVTCATTVPAGHTVPGQMASNFASVAPGRKPQYHRQHGVSGNPNYLIL